MIICEIYKLIKSCDTKYKTWWHYLLIKITVDLLDLLIKFSFDITELDSFNPYGVHQPGDNISLYEHIAFWHTVRAYCALETLAHFSGLVHLD